VQDADDYGQGSERGRTALRALFISDIHLGTRACQADAFLDFLSLHDAPVIYLVGDIIDFWRVRRGAIWPQSHNDVLQKLLRKVRKGTKIYFIPGNHDEALRPYCGSSFGGIEIHRDIVHDTADGRRFLIMHGDEFDVVVRYAKWLAFLGDRSYEFALWCNHPINWMRRRFGFGYWSLSAYLKLRVKSAVNFIGEFEHAIAQEARRRNADGVICGHIHHAADRLIEGIRYINCGDWVESCTAIAEDHAGQLRLIRWHDPIRLPSPAPALRPQLTPVHLIASVESPSPFPAPRLVADKPISLPEQHC
jgi:UDP-2,3-diacylglucosamine pyrophosphatase LpxH